MTAFPLGALIALFCATPAHAAIELRASVDRNQVAVGERIILSIEATGAQNVPAPNLTDVPGFQVQYAGPSTQVSFVNGRTSASVSHRYALFARKEGQFSIGPFAVDYEGQHYEAPAITVTVAAQASGQQSAARGAAGSGNVDIRLMLGEMKSAPFVGERVPLTLTLYVGNARVDDLHYPEFAVEGFTLDKWSEPTQSDEVLNGRRYRAVRFQTTMTPLRPGAFSLAPTMEMALLRSRRRGDPFFDNFFGDAFADREPFRAQAEAQILNVQPLPEAGKPQSFTGAVGHFEFSLDARPGEVNAGDPVTVRMEIKGEGNFDQVSAPVLSVDDRFRRYDATVVKDAEGPNRRAYEQVVIPKTDQVKELPAVRFSFFDPTTASYQTITRGPVPLTVRPPQGEQEAKVIAAPQVAQPAARPVEQLGRDIVYIKDVPDGFWPRGPAFFTRAWFLLLQSLPLVAFIAAGVFARRRDRDAADPRLVRFRNAGRVARAALEATRKDLHSDRFYDDLAAAVSQFLGAKLDLPPGAVERERVLDRLGRNGAAGDISERISDFFAAIERARYAPSASAGGEREEALRLAQSVIDHLDRDRTLATRFASILLAGVALVAAAAAAQNASFNPAAVFFEGNAAYKAGRYADAAASYQSIHDAGYAGGALYFNSGNAHFKEGKVGGAVLGYERALRVRPRDADVRANLAYAREMAKDEPPEPAVWQRIVFSLAERATSGELALVSAVFWWLLWLALILRALFPRFAPAGSRTASIVGVLLLLIGASFIARLSRVELAHSGVVTASGETPVRFEPTPTGTQYFTVNEGVCVDVTEERDEWFQVRRSDGRRGWIPKAAVTEL